MKTFFNEPNTASFLIFVLFDNNFSRKIVDFGRIQTPIGREEGEHTDHLTTTTARFLLFLIWASVRPSFFLFVGLMLVFVTNLAWVVTKNAKRNIFSGRE